MLKVVIADDERRVCNLILNIVTWTELGYHVVATAHNGIEAYEMICEHKPDVVITDARMPGYDGIELIKRVRESGLNPEFIIISGYRYFEYAYNALQYGVEHYILKPINKSELCEALEKIKKSKVAEDEKLGKDLSILNQMIANKEIMRRHFISNFIFDGSSFKTSSIVTLEKINAEYHMNFKEGIYQAVFVKIDSTIQEHNKNKTVLEMVSSEIEACLKGCCQEYISTIAKSGVISIVNYPKDDEEKFKAGIKKLQDKLKIISDKFNYFRIYIALGSKETELRNLSSCISTALEAVKYRIVSKDKDIIEYDNCKYRDVNLQQIFTPERKQQLKVYLETDEKEKYRKLIDTCIKEIHREKNYNPIVLYALYDTIGQTLLQYVSDAGIDPAPYEEIQLRYAGYLENAFEEKMVEETLHNFVQSASACISSEKEFQDTKPIRLAKQYIEEHYAEEISLEIVSREIHLSSAYLSTIFRKETGLNFSEYLINCRIEAAKVLLKKTNKSMNEISESIGYSDVKYFSKLFNKVVGLKPSEYRKLYS
ncbi:MAG: two component transcriptional regulator, AraC family [Clostridiales bacterium]|jgi:two-component system response regulator YesN|nr:two component transcriptional regulator, AraC family [Clostridiales bacterium]